MKKDLNITPAAIGAALNGDLTNALIAATPGGIEAQEAAGQADLCRAERLPKDLGGWNKGDIRAEYEKHGIEVLNDFDDIFLNVKLPEGWKLKPTDHSMHNDLVDEKGRRRAGIFFKAAFYDRSAHINFSTRFRICTESEDAYKTPGLSYEDRKKMPTVGRVYDGNTEIFTCEGFVEADCVNEDGKPNWDLIDRLTGAAFDFAKKWLVDAGYPDFADNTKYWD